MVQAICSLNLSSPLSVKPPHPYRWVGGRTGHLGVLASPRQAPAKSRGDRLGGSRGRGAAPGAQFSLGALPSRPLRAQHPWSPMGTPVGLRPGPGEDRRVPCHPVRILQIL